jgi:hypothetical protein
MIRERSQRDRIEGARLAPDQVQQAPSEEARPARDRTNAPVDSHAGATEKLPATHSASLPLAEPISRPSRQPDVLSGGALVEGIKRELKRLGCYTGPDR